jgi:hypothetical protein
MTTATTRRSRRGTLLIVALALLLAGVVAVSGSGVGKPYDLDDSGDQGYKALGLILGRLGAHVDRIDVDRLSPQLAATAPVAFVPVAEGATSAMVARWRSYARAGGTLVVGTRLPGSRLHNIGVANPDEFRVNAQPADLCDIEALAGLGSIDPDGAAPLTFPDDASSCYGGDDLALVVRQSLGSGSIVTLASPDLFTNEAMRPHDQEVDDPREPMRDNVVVAQRLLDPDGSTHLAVVTSGVDTATSSGHTKSVTDFLSPGVKVGLWELLAAAIFLLWWRARRLGRVVAEAQPVPIAGSELVAAVGNMMSRRHDPGRAAETVRRDTNSALAARLGIARDTDPRLVATMIAQRTGRAEATVAGALFASPVHTDADLIAVTSQLESIRQEMLHGRQPAASVSGAAAPTPVSGGPVPGGPVSGT